MDSESLLEEGYRLCKDGKYEEAERIFRKVLETESESRDVWYALGTVLDYLDRLDDADEAYT
ncbi:MAG: hypothetical protein ACW98Y_10935, partial [Candidatus Thorarchaeota archaeon]